MELYSAHHHLLRHHDPIPRFLLRTAPIFRITSPPQRCHRRCFSKTTAALMEQTGGKMVVELVGAFNELTERMGMLSGSGSHLLFKALKLSIPLLHALPRTPDGRSSLSKALSFALILADLQMDAEVISAGNAEAGAISIMAVGNQIGTGTAHLLHESMRVMNTPSKVDVLDDDSAAALRRFCLTFYDTRAVVLDLVLRLDMMRHIGYLPSYQQQLVALEVMKIHAPLAHAVGANWLSLELEDLSFQCLFPNSYLYVDEWLRSHETGSGTLVDVYKEQLLQLLGGGGGGMVVDVSVSGRYKSRYSTMKKLLKDGRKPEQVNDVLGLRVILEPRSGEDEAEMGERACYRTREVVRSLWKELPHRTKDYIARPKANGYRSLHMAVDVSDGVKTRPLMEIQIRTQEMDMLADAGTASHSLYKSGLTNPEEAKRLKAIMMAAAELAALRLKDIPSANGEGIETEQSKSDRVFRLLDKNDDGRINMEELKEVMEELGAPGEDACEMMELLDANSDGSLSSHEFDLFQKQVEFMRNFEDRDQQYKTELNDKLQIAENNSLIQVYTEDLSGSTAN
ncbi:probable GTP diphosphokinase CRSH, chloroplastic isoform X2 [Argentina anserina]|uniref:probable GTP diphosphokinase CRSH, chloroplastic isoform X2 n=1 Tax=Argentina anserina TaxID=57926 RepID=UPI0021767E4D|nr:probable GTP diphosphokinase CRSH, chloroplastic isoform X2 [Potentilla anserina]